MQITRHRIPGGAEMFRVPAAEILRRPDVLRRVELLEKVIVRRSIKRTFAIDGGFAHHTRLMDVVVLERVVHDSVRHRVAVAMAVRTTGAALRDFVRENNPAALDLVGFGLRRRLRERIGEKPGLVLRPEDLQISQLIIADLARFSGQLRPANRDRVRFRPLQNVFLAGVEAFDWIGLRKERRRCALAQQHFAIAGGRVRHEIVVQPFVPLRPVIGDVLVLRADLHPANRVRSDIPLAAVLPRIPMAEAA